MQPSWELFLIVSLGAAVILALALGAPAVAAEPSPILIDPLDPRAEGEGPGIVGQPLLAAALVLMLGIAAAALAALFARLSRSR